MRTVWKLAAVTAVLVALLAPTATAPNADAAAVGIKCKPVRAGGYVAYRVYADYMPCRSARAKLRRWLRRDFLPTNRGGWYCDVLNGNLYTCAYGAPADRGFTFWLR
jgi:hypothetical protein